MARGRHVGRKTIDNLRWTAGAAANSLALSAGSAATTILTAGVPRETIMRTRGEAVCYMDGAQVPPHLILVSMGLVLVPEGQGTTVIWDPFNDAEAPWFWHRDVIIGYEEMVTDVIDVPVLNGARITVDSKVMRKANVDEEVQFVVTNTTLSGAGSVNVAAAFRFLLGN